jgi:hypothetical protein
MKIKVTKMVPKTIEKEIKIPKIKNATDPYNCLLNCVAGGGDSVHDKVECSKIACSECLFYPKNIEALREMDNHEYSD